MADIHTDMAIPRLQPKLLYAFLLFALAVVPSFGLDKVNVNTNLEIISLHNAIPPKVLDGNILFTYRPDHPVRYVGISFADEAYARVLTLERNSHGVFVLLFRPPPGTEELSYRFVVDGLWMCDPMNSDFIIEERGSRLSRFRFPGAFPIVPSSPIVSEHNIVHFNYYGTPHQRVYLAGDFSEWDPFLYRFSETAPGKYQFSLPLPPGTHWYQFIVDGVSITDPLNPGTAVRGDGKRVSVVVVGK